MDSELLDQLFDPMNCFYLWCDKGVDDISSLCDSPVVFPQNWLPPQLSYTEVTGVHFDVIVQSLFHADKSVRFVAEPVVSDVTEDGDGIPLTTSSHSWGGDSGCSEWLKFVSQGAGPMAPPIRACLCTVMFFQNRGMVYIWIVYTRRESVGVLRMTGSLLHVVLTCRLVVLCDCLSSDCLQVPRFCADCVVSVCVCCWLYPLACPAGLFCRRDGDWEQSGRG